MTERPLEGIKVLAVETQVSAPYCTMMLADAGAEVIKIEPPGRGDVAREPGPILKNEKGEKTSGYFMRFNRNKKSLTLDFRTPQGQEIFKKLAKESDVVVENLRPGSLNEKGLSYEELKKENPGIIYAAISGFGQMEGLRGPFSERPAYDIVIQAMGGMMHLIGHEDGPPLHPMLALGDIIPGIMTAYSILMAIIKRGKTGEGDYIDISMFDVIMAVTERAQTLYSLKGEVMSRGKETLIHPWGAYKTKDGYVALIVLESRMWKRFCDVIGKPELFDDPRFENAMQRAKNREDLDPIINEWMQQYTSEEVTEKLLAEKVPCGPVRNAEDLYNCEHARARNMWIDINDPIASTVQLVGNPVKMLNVEPQKEAAPPPALGQHTDEVLKQAGFSADEINNFKDESIV